MRAYLASLELLLGEDLAILAPGHGYLIGEPHREVRRLVQHRLKREAKVAAALAAHGPCSVDALTPHVYDDVDPALHVWAAKSLHAHLIKLAEDGRAHSDGDAWRTIMQERL